MTADRPNFNIEISNGKNGVDVEVQKISLTRYSSLSKALETHQLKDVLYMGGGIVLVMSSTFAILSGFANFGIGLSKGEGYATIQGLTTVVAGGFSMKMAFNLLDSGMQANEVKDKIKEKIDS